MAAELAAAGVPNALSITAIEVQTEFGDPMHAVLQAGSICITHIVT